MTAVEKLFVRKALETKAVQDTELMRNAMLNAVANAMRKKGKSFIKLWHRNHTADAETAKEQLGTIEQIEKQERGWIDKVYAANGRKKPHGG